MQFCCGKLLYFDGGRMEYTSCIIIKTSKTPNPIRNLHSFNSTQINLNTATGEAGLLQFRNGVKTVGGADEKFSKLKKDVSSYLR
jgi:hypothetical protein